MTRQGEVPEVVGRQLQFEAIDRPLIRRRHHAPLRGPGGGDSDHRLELGGRLHRQGRHHAADTRIAVAKPVRHPQHRGAARCAAERGEVGVPSVAEVDRVGPVRAEEVG